MCGIFGAWERDGAAVDVGRLEAAVSSMRHRGPDDEGYVLIDTATGRSVACGGDDTDPSLGLPHVRSFSGEHFDLALGHRRLAVLDTSPAGHQPMTDGRKWIVHSGEIFNFEELRDRCEDRAFLTGTDTEVLLALFEAGKDLVTPFCDGMWAFAIWDASARELYCSRDRFGIKPFHYAASRSRFVFSSEVKGILAYSGDRTNACESSVLDYLAWGMTDHGPETFFEGVSSLEPGCSMSVDGEGERASRYWDLTAGGDIGTGSILTRTLEAGEAPEALREALAGSVSRRLRADVPVGTLLSGGLDSSTIACLAREALGPDGRVLTFTVGFEAPDIDERRYASEVASLIDADRHEIVVDGGSLLETLPALMRHQEAPVVSSSAYAQWQVMASAKEGGVTVLLDGQGGDELLSGYPQARDIHLRRLVRTGRVLSALREVRASGDAGSALRAALGRSPSRLRRSPGFVRVGASSSETWRYPSSATLRELMANDLRYRVQSLLRFEERSSMAFGLETRVPFLDHSLVLFAYGLEDRDRVQDGVGKAVLRRAMRGLVPDTILDRRDKVGFRTPERDWLLGANLPGVREVVLSGPLRASGYFEGDIERWFGEIVAGREPVAYLWRWLCLTAWMDEFSRHA